jgi:hypothetical protein
MPNRLAETDALLEARLAAQQPSDRARHLFVKRSVTV